MQPDKCVLISVTTKEIIISSNSMEDLAKVVATELTKNPNDTYALYSIYAIAEIPKVSETE